MDEQKNIVPLNGHASGFSVKASHGMASKVKSMKPKPRPQTGHDVMKNLSANLPKMAQPVDPIAKAAVQQGKAHVYRVGELIQIGNSIFEIKAMGRKTLKLRLRRGV
jgi:hypothetical protein